MIDKWKKKEGMPYPKEWVMTEDEQKEAIKKRKEMAEAYENYQNKKEGND